jgi:hypothetical protein
METTTTKERSSDRSNNTSAATTPEKPQQISPSVDDFFTNIQLFDQLAHQKMQIEGQMEELRRKIIPSFNQRFASLGIALPENLIKPLLGNQNRSEAALPEETVGSSKGGRGKGKGGNKRGGVTKLQTAQDIIDNKLDKKFTVKDFRGELERQGKGNWQFGYLIQELRQRGVIKNVGYGEYERV